MAYKTITEGAARVRVPAAQKVSKEMEVFYNPVMKLNRDVTVLLLRALCEERKKEDPEFDGLQVGSPLAGTGIRECRIALELGRECVKSIAINDYSEDAARLIGENISSNKAPNDIGIAISSEDASEFLLKSKGFDYIDIDPFGSPNPFLDAACKRVARGGIIAITATDTSALAGTYPDACARKYWAKPMRNRLMHEVGVRILARKAQLVGAQYDKALVPVYCYSKDHYYRLFLRCDKGKKDVDRLLAQHQWLVFDRKKLSLRCASGDAAGKDEDAAGPLYAGLLWDEKLAARIAQLNAETGSPENQRLFDTIAREAACPLVGFFQLNEVRKALRKQPRPKDELLARKGVRPTHFDGNAVRAERVELLF